MASLPSSLLNRLYEQDSLRNTERGFEVAFKNRLAPSTLVGVGRLEVDSHIFEGDALTLHLERPAVGFGRPPETIVRSASEITEKRSLPFAVNAVARLAVTGEHLTPGHYKVKWSFKTKEVGDITVQATDEVTGA